MQGLRACCMMLHATTDLAEVIIVCGFGPRPGFGARLGAPALGPGFTPRDLGPAPSRPGFLPAPSSAPALGRAAPRRPLPHGPHGPPGPRFQPGTRGAPCRPDPARVPAPMAPGPGPPWEKKATIKSDESSRSRESNSSGVCVLQQSCCTIRSKFEIRTKFEI